MRSETKSRRISVRGSREDGDATKNRIIEAAGKLFAERGYAETTSKEICETVGANMAAVNYHFGSRDGLYMAVLEKVRDYLTDNNSLSGRLKGTPDPREKLRAFVASFLHPVFERQTWALRVWARELVSPTGVGMAFRRDKDISGFRTLIEIISGITGIPADDPLIKYCILNIMGPFMVLLIVSPEKSAHEVIFAGGEKLAAERLEDFMLGGLDAFAAKYAKHGNKQ